MSPNHGFLKELVVRARRIPGRLRWRWFLRKRNWNHPPVTSELGDLANRGLIDVLRNISSEAERVGVTDATKVYRMDAAARAALRSVYARPEEPEDQ